MALVAEQVKYIREKRNELLKRKVELLKDFSDTKDKDTIDTSMTYYGDYMDRHEYHRVLDELDYYNHLLQSNDIKLDRNLDTIEVGTSFFATFMDEVERDRFTLVEFDAAQRSSSHLISLDSDFGKAVRGHTSGDDVDYTIGSTGRKVKLHIDYIDRLQDRYTHFLCEQKKVDRFGKNIYHILSEISQTNSKEYVKWNTISASQVDVALEEYNRNSTTPKRREEIKALLDFEVGCPTDHTIGVGSRVKVRMNSPKGYYDTEKREFEFINSAISYELADHYVERISDLGCALYGLKAGDFFEVNSLFDGPMYGEVLAVDNSPAYQYQRVMK